jgi:hypothetical protein
MVMVLTGADWTVEAGTVLTTLVVGLRFEVLSLVEVVGVAERA